MFCCFNRQYYGTHNGSESCSCTYIVIDTIHFYHTGDSLKQHQDGAFVTFDHGGRSDCASADNLKTGWWLKPDSTDKICTDLLDSNLNGEYKTDQLGDDAKYAGITWKDFKGEFTPLKETEMRLLEN